MSRQEILWELYLPEGRQYQAAWWMFEYQNFSKNGVIYKGVPVNHTVNTPTTDRIG